MFRKYIFSGTFFILVQSLIHCPSGSEIGPPFCSVREILVTLARNTMQNFTGRPEVKQALLKEKTQ